MAGVEGRPVYMVAHRNLSAAISHIAPAELKPDLSRLRAYDKVIAAFHHGHTLIPMRYGCVLADDSQVSRVLAERGPLFVALLRELEGCVEMGLRLLLPANTRPFGGPEAKGGHPAGEPTPVPISAPERPGLAYIKARKAYYARQEVGSQEYHQTAQLCLAALKGLYVKVKTEDPTPRLPLLSLYFLVRRPVLEEFRQAFHRFSLGNSARALLSGPWPPYNFVVPSHSGEVLSSRSLPGNFSLPFPR